jgi:hypothetical protein
MICSVWMLGNADRWMMAISAKAEERFHTCSYRQHEKPYPRGAFPRSRAFSALPAWQTYPPLGIAGVMNPNNREFRLFSPRGHANRSPSVA